MKQKKLLINFLSSFLIAGLLFTGGLSFSQTSSPPAETIEGASPSDETLHEDHDTQKLDKVLKEYNKNQKQVEQDAEVIKQMQATGELSEEELDQGQLGDEEYQKAYKQAQNVLGDAVARAQGGKKTDLKNIKYSDAVRITLGPLQKLPEEELMQMLKENTKDTRAGAYVEHFPKLMLFAVRLIKDRDAIPFMVKIIDDQDKLIRFGGLMIATFLLGFFLKRLMAREGRSIPKALLFWFLRFIIMSGVRLGIILYFYSVELSPMFKVAGETFF